MHPEGTHLMTWVSNKLTDINMDKLASDISQKIDGANNAVNEISRANFSCGDGVLGSSFNSKYSSAVRISQLDLDETPSDEELAIEVEYIPKDTHVETCNLTKSKNLTLPYNTGESLFAVSSDMSTCSVMNATEIKETRVSIASTSDYSPPADTAIISGEKISRSNRK